MENSEANVSLENYWREKVPLNSYALPGTKKTPGERKLKRGIDLMPWKCHECWKLTKMVALPRVIGKNWKREMNTEFKRNLITNRVKTQKPKYTLLCYPDHCKREGE
jgi:hypothetical protein